MAAVRASAELRSKLIQERKRSGSHEDRFSLAIDGTGGVRDLVVVAFSWLLAEALISDRVAFYSVATHDAVVPAISRVNASG